MNERWMDAPPPSVPGPNDPHHPEARWIHDLLAASARRNPGDPLLIHPNGRDTYGEMARRAAQFAHTLATLGAPGDRVAILAENTATYVAAYYGAAAAGWISVPLNTSLPADGLAFGLADAGARVLVSEDRFATVASAAVAGEKTAGRVVISDRIDYAGRVLSLEEAFAPGRDRFPECPVSPDAPASIVYTSGSTGRPRGAVLTHRGLLANTRSIIQYLRLSAADRVMVVLPFYYVYGKSLLNTHVAVGGSLVVGTDLYFPNEVVARIEEETATGFAGVPSTFAVLMHRSRLPGAPPPSLRYVTQAGGAMAPDLTRRVVDALPGVEVFVMYGATEASARLTYLEPSEVLRRVGSIGKPIAGVRIRVLREDGTEARTGEPGELVAQGENLMLGYWNDPEETRAVLSPEGLRTGDLAYRDENGFLYIVGRKKEMIKCGAHRISPKEIEEVLVEHPAVLEAAVIGVPDAVLGEAILAFVVPAGEAPPDLARDLRRHAVGRLPEYKVPGVIELREELPKNAAGKIQKRDLRAEYDAGLMS